MHSHLRRAVRWLPEVVTRLPVVNNRVGVVGSGGRRLVYPVSHSSEGKPSLFLVDPATGQATKHRLPEGETGAYGIDAADGRIWIGTLRGRLYVFDPATAVFEPLGEPFPGEYIWGAGSTPGGLFACGTYPSGSFAVWDVATRRLRHRERSDRGGGEYCRTFIGLPDGRMLVVSGGARIAMAVFDPATDRVTWHPTDAFSGQTFVYDVGRIGDRVVLMSWPNLEIVVLRASDLAVVERIANEDFYVRVIGDEIHRLGTETGDLEAWRDGAWRRVAQALDREVGDFCELDERTVCGVSVDGRFFRCDRRGGTPALRVALPTEETSAVNLSALAWDGGDGLYVSTHLNQHLARIDLAAATCVDLGVAVNSSGQVNSLRWHDGRLWIASYIHAKVLVHDPAAPYELLANPALVGTVGEDQYRPVGAIEWAAERLWFATFARYGELGGAIVEVDPATRSLRAHRHVIRDQNLGGLVLEPRSGLLVTAGFVRGDQGSCEPRTPAARWAAFDPRTRRVVAEGVLEPAAEEASALAALGDGRVVLGTYAGRLWTLDPAEARPRPRPLELPDEFRPVTQLLRVADGRVFGLAGRGLFAFDPATGRAEHLADVPKPHRALIELQPGRLAIASGPRVAVVDV